MHEERRRSWRFPVLEEQQSAELRVGDAPMTVRLINQSATGFQIECDQRPGVYAGENVWLQTAGGWTEVKVIKIRHEIDRTCIGLERLADVSLDVPRTTGVLKRDALEHESSSGSPWPTIIMMVALGSVMSFLAWTAYGRHFNQRGLGTIHRGDHAKVAQSAAAMLQAEDARRGVELQESVKVFGAALLALPDVARHLQLSNDQAARLREIISRALANARQLRGDGAAAGDMEKQVAGLYDLATQQALAVLTREQRASWDELHRAALALTPPGQTTP